MQQKERDREQHNCFYLTALSIHISRYQRHIMALHPLCGRYLIIIEEFCAMHLLLSMSFPKMSFTCLFIKRIHGIENAF